MKYFLFLAPVWILAASISLLVFPATSRYFQFALGFNLLQHLIYVAIFYLPFKKKKVKIVTPFISLSALQFFSFLFALMGMLVLNIDVMYLFHGMWIFFGLLTMQIVQITKHLKLLEKPLDKQL
ncbi:MAG: hypothetical protein WCG64_02410 [Flavobacteriia bacterium]|nr:hypothetical protein [Flavobacteriia bacterium]